MKTTAFCLAAVLAAAALGAQAPSAPSRAVTDPGVITTRQAITPAGVQSVFEGRVFGLAFGATTDELWVLTGRTQNGRPHVYRLDWARNQVRGDWELTGTPALQGLVFDAKRGAPLVGLASPVAGTKAAPTVRLLQHTGTGFTPLAEGLGSHLAASPAVSRGGARERVVMPLVFDNALAVLDAVDGRVISRIKTKGVAPFGAALSRDGQLAWVSNWGGRWPEDGDVTAATGLAADADRVVVDQRGIASTGTVVRVDLERGTVTDTVNVGLQPTAMVWDEGRERLFVANANSDSISVVDTRARRITATIGIEPFGLPLKGIAPTALAVAPDGRTLYVALGGLNAVAVVDVNSRAVRGFIPTAWYPNGLVLSPDGTRLAVSTLLGVGSGYQNKPERRQVHAYRGTVNVLSLPDQAQLASYTTAVAENNHIVTARERLAGVRSDSTTALPVPLRSGDPSTIEHVVYIIKENRTYDQVFGDMAKGNSDPSLVMFGEPVTPNHHRLADEFVLLDNFYATGGNSGDGHQWVTQANESTYAMWPGWAGRSYPFDGSDPIAYANTGFLWDLARARGKTVRVYGEFAGRLPENDSRERESLLDRWKAGEDFSKTWSITAPLAPLNALLAKNYPSYSQSIPDVVRAQIFLKDFAEWKQAGRMPNLTILQLPADHTRGATPNASTPSAMVADNDLALGRIVEALSNSPFWPKMAIFVVEDDAQNGVDHVDGHRTVALAISPYTRRGVVDSTFYAHQSMVKTIELMLGLPTMSLFDLIATDMRASFTTTADVRPYAAVEPQQSLFERNPVLSAMKGPLRDAAEATMRMRFDVPDAAPTETLNRIVWGMVKGWDRPYPPVQRAVFAPMSIDLDDDQREAVTH
ncbi:MAG: alkaline phosphatase family protein [Vicinamibacterales bacterium]|nr:alkaline phosphatase family protein [Vicinamibacterales bacterium]